MILVVEDNPGVADVFAEAIRGAGHDVTIASTGTDALICTAERSFALIVMDLSLPDINGAEIMRQLRAGGDGTPVIAASGAVELIDADRLMEIGFAAVIEKPLRLSALLELIKQHARG